jgi:cyclophilin family peptidyl-prolyl cis-trans isomerase
MMSRFRIDISRERRPALTRALIALTASLWLATSAVAQVPGALEARIDTSMGTIVVALDRAHAPLTVDNFVRYAREGHFDGTVIYRVVPGFVIQAGSYDAQGNARPVHDPITLESSSGRKNLRGAIAMARDTPASATAEFFIDLSDEPSLDAAPADAPGTTGYAVFGKVVTGMDVVDKIAAVPLGGKGPFPGAAPMTPVTIEKVAVTDAAGHQQQ